MQVIYSPQVVVQSLIPFFIFYLHPNKNKRGQALYIESRRLATLLNFIMIQLDT